MALRRPLEFTDHGHQGSDVHDYRCRGFGVECSVEPGREGGRGPVILEGVG